MLRKAFLFDRSLYGELPRAAYAATRDFLQGQFPGLDRAVPAMVAAPQSHGSLLNFHPHLHTLSSLGVFDLEGRSYPARGPPVTLKPSHEKEEVSIDPLPPDEAYCVDPDPGSDS